MLLRKNGVTQILHERSYDEEPLFAPDPSGWRLERIPTVELSSSNSSIENGADVATAAAACLTNASPCSALDYHRAYLHLNITPTHVAEAVLTYIEESEALDPPMRFFIAHDAVAVRAAAAASTARYAAGLPLSPLDGVPFGVKDEADVEGYVTTAGTSFLATHRQTQGTLPAVQSLLEAGAILVGKLNMHEIGLGTTGLNPIHGTPRNPHNVQHHTGGSSSGSAAAVAAGLVPFAIGFDGGGSIRIPAALCGVCGLKPTTGRVSSTPGPPICHSVGTAGPIAASVRDCALLYALMADRGNDTIPLTLPDKHVHDEVLLPLAGLTAGVHYKWFEDADPGVVTVCKHALEVLRSALGMVIKPIRIAGIEDVATAHSCTISSEMRSSMAQYCKNKTLRRQLTAETRISLAVAEGFSGGAYVNAQKIRRRADREMRAVFTHVDVIVTPATPCTAPRILDATALSGGASDLGMTTKLMKFCQLANMLGLPAVVLPVGSCEDTNMPVGLQIMGPAWHEATLLHVAAALEDKIKFSSTPAVYYNTLHKASSQQR